MGVMERTLQDDLKSLSRFRTFGKILGSGYCFHITKTIKKNDLNNERNKYVHIMRFH